MLKSASPVEQPERESVRLKNELVIIKDSDMFQKALSILDHGAGRNES